MERSPDNSLMVVSGDEVVVAAAHNAVAADDVAAIVGVVAVDDVVVVVGATAVVVVWVKWCSMRPCISPQFHFVSAVVTLTGKESSWWDR